MVQEACFRYYWEAAHPNAGMAIEILPGDKNLVALGSSGFGIMAIVVGVEREFITRKQGVERLRARLASDDLFCRGQAREASFPDFSHHANIAVGHFGDLVLDRSAQN